RRRPHGRLPGLEGRPRLAVPGARPSVRPAGNPLEHDLPGRDPHPHDPAALRRGSGTRRPDGGPHAAAPPRDRRGHLVGMPVPAIGRGVVYNGHRPGGRRRLDVGPVVSPPGEVGDGATLMEGARVVQLEVPDLDGGLRAKLVSPAKARSEPGAAMCTIMFGLTQADDVYESPASSAANGYPDLVMRPDLATLRALPWCEATVAVLCDLYGGDGARFPLAPRTVLRTVVERCADLGFEARFAAEWEFCVVHRDDEAQPAGLVPLGRTMNAYSSLRLRELRPLAQAFFERMEGVGIAVEAVHTELGHGMVEFALAHAPAMEAADPAARAKASLKELCGERGLVATFMPKWRAGAPTSGCHFHQSLWRDGSNEFAGPGGALSPLARHYLAGQLATMTDFGALFNPSV